MLLNHARSGTRGGGGHTVFEVSSPALLPPSTLTSSTLPRAGHSGEEFLSGLCQRCLQLGLAQEAAPALRNAVLHNLLAAAAAAGARLSAEVLASVHGEARAGEKLQAAGRGPAELQQVLIADDDIFNTIIQPPYSLTKVR